MPRPIQKRLNTVKSAMENAKHFHSQVVNDEVDRAVFEIEKIIKNEQV